jgi:hypothetical protein
MTFPDLPASPPGETLRGVMLYLQDIYTKLSPLGVEHYAFTSGYALPVEADHRTTFMTFQNALLVKLRTSLVGAAQWGP